VVLIPPQDLYMKPHHPPACFMLKILIALYARVLELLHGVLYIEPRVGVWNVVLIPPQHLHMKPHHPPACFMLKILIVLYARVLELLRCTTQLNAESLSYASSEARTSVWFYLKEPSLRTLVCLCRSACLPVQCFTLYLWHVNT